MAEMPVAGMPMNGEAVARVRPAAGMPVGRVVPKAVRPTTAGSRRAAVTVGASAAATGRAWAPVRQCVKIPDHVNIALKAMTSNRARLIVAVTNSHAPAKRNTNTSEVAIGRRFGRRWSRKGEVSRSAAKPRTIIPATLSCRSLLVLSGMHPTRARFTPITVRKNAAAVGAPRRPARRPRRARSRRTRTA